jgi:CheY-like chemotaxis protein
MSLPQPIRVIIVEDNQDDRTLLIRQLRKINIESNVKFIADGKEALDFLFSLNPEIVGEIVAIFLDLRLPSVDGLEVLRQIRQKPVLLPIPVIIMTSSINPRTMEQCNELKVYGFIAKPITFASFSRAVADIFHLPSGTS